MHIQSALPLGMPSGGLRVRERVLEPSLVLLMLPQRLRESDGKANRMRVRTRLLPNVKERKKLIFGGGEKLKVKSGMEPPIPSTTSLLKRKISASSAKPTVVNPTYSHF